MQTDRLTTIDEYGSRRFVIPAEVTGPFRTWRNRVNTVLILIFLALPWIKINGLQSVLLDIPNRRFEIFGKLFLAHDSPLIFLLVAIAVMALAFVTAVWGRVWCGWACPQTVFIDGLYRKIEILIEGEYKVRRRLQREGFTAERIWKSVAKWTAYFVVSSLIAHSFIAYFTGSSRLIEMIQGSPAENWTYFLLISGMTAVLLFNFGWFREQFCTIMCPYGRFQSVLMDDRSLTVLYDEKRGEPRKGAERGAANRGDCVSCNRCVEVCPAGIDIRKGVQLECIACTACIDACNVIMKRVNKPENLIRYASVSDAKFRIWRLRTVAYMAILLVCTAVLALNFMNHDPFAVTMLRGKDVPFQVLTDGNVSNHFKLHLFNQSQAEQEFFLRLTPEAERAGLKIMQASPSVRLLPGKSAQLHFFVSFPKEVLGGRGESGFSFLVEEARSGILKTHASTIIGPVDADKPR